jgi:hypothetical protein
MATMIVLTLARADSLDDDHNNTDDNYQSSLARKEAESTESFGATVWVDL